MPNQDTAATSRGEEPHDQAPPPESSIEPTKSHNEEEGLAQPPLAGDLTAPDGLTAPGDLTLADDIVAAALEQWRMELLELAGGSALWDIDSLGEAVIDLTGAHPSGIAQLYAGRRTRLSNVVREGSALSQARRQARIVLARTDELAGQFGVAPTYVAMGVARWFMADDPKQARSELDLHTPDGRMVQVPVLLRPVRMQSVAGNDLDMELDPQVEVNPVLVRALRLHGVQVDPALLAASTKREHGFTPRPALDAISTLGGALPDFSLEARIIVGAFVHPGQALAEDLQTQHEHLLRHDVVRAFAGVEEDLKKTTRPIPSRRLEDLDPDSERGIGDLDSAQHQILDAISSGSHLLIDSPPGVDVASTVSAIIADAAKKSCNVLYVPGTRRAGAAVHDALRRLGAGDLVLDLLGDAHWRKTAAHRLTDGLNPPTPDIPHEVALDRAALVETRTTLGNFIGALHLPRSPWGVSANRVLHELAELTSQRPGPRTQVRLPSSVVRSLSDTQRGEARGSLIRAAELGAFHLRASDTPWYGAVLRNAEHATDTLARVQSLAQVLPQLREQVASTAAQTGLDEARTLTDWAEQLELLDGISAALDLFTSEIFERSADDMVAATATKQWRQEREITLSRGVIRRLRKQAKDLVRPGVVVNNLHDELVKVADLRKLWRRHCSGGGWPRLPEQLTQINATYEGIHADIDELNAVLRSTTAGRDLDDLPLAQLTAKFARLAGDEDTLQSMPERAESLANLSQWGFEPLLDDLSTRRVNPAGVGPEFDLAWWSSVLEEMLTEDPAMVALDPATLEQSLADFRRLDVAQTESLLAPVLGAHSEHMRDAIVQHRAQAQEFYRAVKQQGEVDLRHLVSTYPDVVMRARPAWLMAPMVVPQVLPPGQQADIVILDAVHRLGIEYLLPAIARARQVIVIADTARPGIDVVQAFQNLPRISLLADRVDRDADIAAFLAASGYAESIQPVPSPPQLGQQNITLHMVDGTGAPAPDSELVESVQVEVDRVVDLVIDHALSFPEESLAVVTLNTRHAERIREAIAEAARDSTAVAEFFDPDSTDGFAVVSIDGAAGLRRDAVILTLGYGKTPHGRVLHRFGAVSGPHGAGLLIDAIDACRNRLTVVSCFGAHDLDPYRLRSDGAKLLRDLLEFAGSGVRPSGGNNGEDEEPDRLLVDLAERLWRLGLTVVPRYGLPGGVRIPLALGHPSLPGELLMAISTDDADYTGEPSLRRRDRHWPERLQRRGWHERTVFSTAVFMDPQGEAERIAAEVMKIVAQRLGVEAVEVLAPPAVVLDGAEDLVTESEQQAVSSQAPPPVRVSARGETMAGQTTGSMPAIVTSGLRGPRPEVEPGLPISGYSDDQLDALVTWLGSDGKMRSAEQYVLEMRDELGLTRRSAHIDTVLRAAVGRGDLREEQAQNSDTTTSEVADTEGETPEVEPSDQPEQGDELESELGQKSEPGPSGHEQPAFSFNDELDPAAEPDPATDAEPQGPQRRKRQRRRVTRLGTEDPEFRESAWRVETSEDTPGDDDTERILREKPPHW